MAITATLITIGLCVLYLRRVRMDRPAIGTFNGRDIVVLFGFIVALPLLYLILPLTPLLVALGLTFTSALVIGLRPIIGPTATWIVVGIVIAANIWMGRTMLGTVLGWQLFWIENDILVICAAVTTANLYVQGGMRLRHVAWFGLILAVYDAIFTFVWPVTNTLAQRFIGWPFDPSVGIPHRHLQRDDRPGRPARLRPVRDRRAEGVRSAGGAGRDDHRCAVRRGRAGAASRPDRRVHRRTDRRHRAGAGGVRPGGLPVLPVAAAHVRRRAHHGGLPR